MHSEEKMTFTEMRKYLRIMQKRYRKASLQEKSLLLDEMQTVTGLHRKTLIRLMNSHIDTKRKPRRSERGPTYGPEVRYALSVIAQTLDYPSAERLQPQLVPMAQLLAEHDELELTPPLLDKLSRISISTVRRFLASIPRDKPRPPAKSPRTKSPLLKAIPIRRIPWDEREPGHFEVDLVHHCGPSASGEYVCTIQMVDIATGWSECRAVLGRSYTVVKDAFLHILSRLPFAVKEIHSDNGNEFLNWHLLRFWKESLPDVQISRSRPYHKNDNRFVEQRNSSLVRAYVGYDRLDTVAQTILLNEIYDKLWLYHNLYLPVMRLKEKMVVPSAGSISRVKRVYDQAQTPLQRLENTSAVEPERLELLKSLYWQINPRKLREEIYVLIEQLFALPGAEPGKTEDVYQTINLPSTLPAEILFPVTLSFE